MSEVSRAMEKRHDPDFVPGDFVEEPVAVNKYLSNTTVS